MKVVLDLRKKSPEEVQQVLKEAPAPVIVALGEHVIRAEYSPLPGEAQYVTTWSQDVQAVLVTLGSWLSFFRFREGCKA